MKAIEIFQDYAGTGLIMLWYFLALIWLFLKEERKDRRAMFLYVPAIILALFFCPLFSTLFSRFVEIKIYFRLLWLLPVTGTLSYTIVQMASKLQKKKTKIFCCIAVVLVVFSGTLVYFNPSFSKAENIHHVPEDVVQICDMIVLEGREVKAAFPQELVCYVRQYSAGVCMPYGRELFLGGEDKRFNDLYLQLQKRVIDMGEVAYWAKKDSCHYIILAPQGHEMKGCPEDYDYELYGQVGNYLIYRDTTMDFRTTME